jgi:hypothetical protein
MYGIIQFLGRRKFDQKIGHILSLYASGLSKVNGFCGPIEAVVEPETGPGGRQGAMHAVALAPNLYYPTSRPIDAF